VKTHHCAQETKIDQRSFVNIFSAHNLAMVHYWDEIKTVKFILQWHNKMIRWDTIIRICWILWSRLNLLPYSLMALCYGYY